MAHRVAARNDAEQSENKIHDDAVARQYGFRGGLVPGVTVYGYLTWLPVEAWGEDWLERGAMSARLVKPVYDGDSVDVVALEPTAEGHVPVTASNADGLCASGEAWMPERDGLPFTVADFERRPVPDQRPPADERSLAPGTALATIERTYGPAERAAALGNLGDDHELYDRLGVAHPGVLIRAANEVLSRTVRLGPWIHVSSTALNHGVVPDGSTVTTYGRVTDRYERKGHHFVDLDVLSVVDDRPVLSVRHTAIYEPRSGG